MSGKIITIIVGLLFAAFAFAKLDVMNKPTVEGWWGGTQFTTRAMPAAEVNGQKVAIGGNYLNPNLGSGKFVSTPGYQAVLAPRFGNVQYGSNIRYNMPDRENTGIPCNPLTFGDMAQENYKPPMRDAGAPGGANFSRQMPNQVQENYGCGTGSCGSTSPASCGKGGVGLGHSVAGGYELPSGYTNGNYANVYDSLPAQGQNLGHDLPVGTMATMDGAGNVDQFVAFQRIMPANTKASSRLRAQGDPIRGDLPIVPCQSGWYSVFPDLSRDLQEGAMNVLTNSDKSDYNQLLTLIANASGGTQSALGGANLSDYLPVYNSNMGTESVTNLKAAMGDINVTSFP
jgi:hypothetical protein